MRYSLVVNALICTLVGYSQNHALPSGILRVSHDVATPRMTTLEVTNPGQEPIGVPTFQWLVTCKPSLRDANGNEPPRTRLGAYIFSKDFELGGSMREHWLNPGEHFTESIDLHSLWVLKPGRYSLTIEREIDIKEKPRFLRATVTVTIPPDYVHDVACSIEQKTIREPNRTRALLVEAKASQKSPQIDRLLERAVAVDAAYEPDQSIVTAFQAVSRNAQIPAGMAYTTGRLSNDSVCLQDAATVRQAVEAIRMSRSSLSFDWSAPIPNLLDTDLTDFLETHIAVVRVPHPLGDPTGSLEAIFSSPEMLARARELQLENQRHSRPESDAHPMVHPAWYNTEVPITLENLTARQALNAIATNWGAGLWVYSERPISVDGGRSFSVGGYITSRAKR